MYVRTTDGLGQVPMLHGSFAGTLGNGTKPLPPEIQEFLKQVEKRPKDFKKLFLTVTFHPQAMDSQIKVTVGKGILSLLDASLIYNLTPPGIFLDELRRIRDKFKTKDPGFQRQIEDELQLRNDMIRTTGELVTSAILKTKGNLAQNKTLTSFLLEAMRATVAHELAGLGLSFALRMLPPKLAERIRNSEASEAHFTNLGRLLRRYAEEQQKKQHQGSQPPRRRP